MGYILPPVTTFRYETHTTVYYRIKVGTIYHAEEFVDLRWYIIKDLGARGARINSINRYQLIKLVDIIKCKYF